MISLFFPLSRLWVFLLSMALVASLSIPSSSTQARDETHGVRLLSQDKQDDIINLLGFSYDQVPLTLPRSGQSNVQNQGWLSRWLSMGGEGEVVVHLPHNANTSLPHRPAAFPNPSHLNINLPLSGFLIPFEKLNHIPSTSPNQNPQLACLPPTGLPRPPPTPPKDEGESWVIGLIERGGCDFATKIRAAQDRGCHAVIVGDSVSHQGESDEEGRKRESLITMFSPEDTESIFIPSVFVSRASYLTLRDLLANGTSSGRQEREGLWIDLSQGSDEAGALTSLLSFALLMPSLFLLATIAIHRVRVARQREKDRAPPLIVLSLPERVWTPDIVWEKDDSSSDRSTHSTKSRSSSPAAQTHQSTDLPIPDKRVSFDEQDNNAIASSSSSTTPLPPPITASEVKTPPAVSVEIPDPLSGSRPPQSISPILAEGSTNKDTRQRENQGKHRVHVKRQYFSKDECAICMDNFEKGDIVRILPCGHVFHKEECDEWLMKWRKLCPTCRADVTLPPGGNVKGSTLTPVSNPPGLSTSDTQEVDEGNSSWTSLFRSARERLYGYGAAVGIRRNNRLLLGGNDNRSESSDGERTPLVTRSPEPNSRRRGSSDV